MLLPIHREIAYQIRTVGNRCLPSYIRPPYPKARLAEILSTDPSQNEKSTPPEDEVIDLCSMWVTEFYTPAYMDDMLNDLEHLGWNKVDGGARNPVSQLSDYGTSQFGQRWIPLGRIVSRDDSDYYNPRPLSTDLPQQVKYAYGDIYCFTPSLIALTIEFVFDEEYRWAFQEALRQDRESYVTPIETTSYMIHDPGHQKKDHIEKIRKDAAKVVSNWIENNVPGLFSAGLLKGDFPTCEFVTLNRAIPFPMRTELDDSDTDYLKHLGLNSRYEAWKSAQYPGLRLDPVARSAGLKHHAILSIKESNWVEQESLGGENQNRESRIYRMHMTMVGILGIWAILPLLRGYADHFKELRKSTLLGYPSDGQFEDALKGISESLSFSVDISAVTSELASYVYERIPLGFDIETFTPCADWPGNTQEASLWGNIHNQIGEYAKWLQAMDDSLRDQMTQYGNLLGMLEDIRLQKQITWLTIVLAILTVVLTVFTILSFPGVQWSDIENFMLYALRILRS